MKKDLEDIRNGAGDVRAFRHIDGHINSVEDTASIRKAAPAVTAVRIMIIKLWDMCLSILMAMLVVADTTTIMTMTMKSIPMSMAMIAAVVMIISMKMKNTLTHMRTATNAAADMTTATNMLMYTDITFPVILLTVIAKSAIRMRSTAMYAAKAWLIAPAVCRMPIKLSAYIFCKTLAVLTALPNGIQNQRAAGCNLCQRKLCYQAAAPQRC